MYCKLILTKWKELVYIECFTIFYRYALYTCVCKKAKNLISCTVEPRSSNLGSTYS